jgi:hypothetical protein
MPKALLLVQGLGIEGMVVVKDIFAVQTAVSTHQTKKNVLK